MKMGMVQRRRRRDLSTLDGLVRAGRLQVVNPTTDTGWRSYDSGGRLFLPAGTNYVPNPRLVDDNADGLPNLWEVYKSDAGFSVTTAVTVDGNGKPAIRFDVSWTADVSQYAVCAVRLAGTTAAASFAATDPASISMVVQSVGAFVNAQYMAVAEAYNSGGAYLGTGVSNGYSIVEPTSPTRISGSSATLPATTDKLKPGGFNIQARTATGGEAHFIVSQLQLEKSPFPTPYFDGNTHDCAWTGTPNASTSTRGLSMLIYDAGKLNIEQSGTVAVRGFPLWDVATSAYGGSGLVSAKGAGSISWAVGNKNSGNPNWYHLYNDGTTQNGPVWSLPSGAAPVHLVGRLGPTTVDLNFNGTDKTQLVTTNNRSLISYIGYYGLCASTVGPTLISPTRKSDAWVTAIQANSGAAYNDPVRLYREFMSPGDMLIPLQGDSRAYKKV